MQQNPDDLAEGTVTDPADLLGSAAGVVRRDDRCWVRVTGVDRADYLHRMLTQDVMALGPAQSRPACLLTPRGRILADLLLWNAGASYWLDLPRNAESAVTALEKYVIMEDTTFERDDALRLDVIGPTAADRLADAGLSLPDRGGCREGELGGHPVHVLHAALGRRPRYLLHVSAAAGSDAAPVLTALEEAGIPRVDMQAYHVARVEEGVPEFGPEMGAEVFFNEVGLRTSVSWAKGCFPGQEPVVMAIDRGHPARALCVLATSGPETPALGTPLLHAGAEVGSVTSAVFSPAAGGVRMLGFVKHGVAQVGADIELPGGAETRIVRVRRLGRD